MFNNNQMNLNLLINEKFKFKFKYRVIIILIKRALKIIFSKVDIIINSNEIIKLFIIRFFLLNFYNLHKLR